MSQKGEAPKKRNEFITRTLSGAVLLAVVLGCLMFGKATFLLLLLIIGLGSQIEFLGISRQAAVEPSRLLPLAIGALVICGAFFSSAELLLLAIGGSFLLFVLELYRGSNTPLGNIAAALMSVFYTTVPMAALALIGLRGGEYNYRYVLAIIAITWINDIFAYIVGVTMGRHRLFERISPKKSWEGFFGGLLFATAAAVAVGAMLGESLLIWGGLGVVVVMGAVLGDLVESMFKRSVGVKDSGALIPGHGGMLDRFDALLFAAPFVLFYLTIVNL